MMKILGGMAALIVLIPVVRSFTNDDAAEPGARQVPVVTQRDTPADDSFEELIVFDSITAGRRTFTLDLPNNYAAVYVSFHVANTPDDILKYGPWASTLDVNGVRVMEWIEFDGSGFAVHDDRQLDAHLRCLREGAVDRHHQCCLTGFE